MLNNNTSTEREKALLLFSGGLDSTVLLHYLVQQEFDVTVMTFTTPAVYNPLERAKVLDTIAGLRKFADIKLVSVDVTDSFLRTVYEQAPPQDPDNCYDPCRNLVFLSYAVRYAEQAKIPLVYIGTISPDNYEASFNDATEQFIDGFNDMLKAMNSEVEVIAPFDTRTKAQIMEMAHCLGVKLESTWSCTYPVLVDGVMTPCGECANCTHRKKFADAKFSLIRRIF